MSTEDGLKESIATPARACIADAESCLTECKPIELSAREARRELPEASRVGSQFMLDVPSEAVERRVEVGSGGVARPPCGFPGVPMCRDVL